MAPESYRASDHRTGRKLHGPNSHCAQFPIRIIFRPMIFGTTAASGEPTDWLLETTSPSILVRLGWTRSSLKAGDRVRAQIFPLSDREQHDGTLERVTSLETGKSFGTNNREQEKPNLE
jgi:hypothetical protein